MGDSTALRHLWPVFLLEGLMTDCLAPFILHFAVRQVSNFHSGTFLCQSWYNKVLMIFSRRHSNITRRATAWLLMLVCAWMGTAGVLHHTETLAVAGHGPAGLHRQTAAAPLDTCAACEWTQGLQGRTLSVCRVQVPLFAAYWRRCTVVPSIIALTLPSRASRAPPTSTTFC